jgi:hypothetical protein
VRVIQFFTGNSKHLGINAPNLIWIASAALVLLAIGFLLWLLWRANRARRPLKLATERLRKIQAQFPLGPDRGLAATAYEQVEAAFSRSGPIASAWAACRGLIIRRRSDDDEDEFWLAETSGDAFGDEAVFGKQLNRSIYVAFPGIVTGLGLLFTFIAILMALMSVHQDPKTMLVSGVNGLINGLSGKFVSSVVALALATIFIFFEKHEFHGLAKARLNLIGAVDSLFPRLSPTHILAKLERDAGEQTLAFRQFNTDLSTRLKQSFSESLGPTLQRMVETVDEMNGLLRQAEVQKQESITGSLQGTLEKLESSISASLHQMGQRFSDSLSGSTMGQFAKITESLGGAAGLLENMNSQFQLTQTALNDVVMLAKNSAVEQMALGKTQVEELTAVLRQMMVQLNETANSSTSLMARTLTGLVTDLSLKVAELNQQMAQTVEDNASRASAAASAVIDQAGAWSSQNAQQFDEILRQQKSHLQSVKEVEASLVSALELFNDSVAQYAGLNSALRKTASEAAAMATAAAGAAHSTQETQSALQQVAAQATAQVTRLGEANRAQQEVWESIRKRMEQFRDLFAQTEKSASGLLGRIGQASEEQLRITQQRYDDLLKTFDEHFSAAVRKLGGSVRELSEYLDELNDSISKAKVQNDGRRS